MYDIPVILASASPRRRELLSQLGVSFEIMPAQGEEIVTSDDPKTVVQELSACKAGEVAGRVKKDPVLIIGADTIVVKNGRILGKPKDEDDAFRMLSMLQGRMHHVYTGVTLILRQDGAEKKRTFFEETKVYFSPMTPKQIRRYIATGDPMDKAGAYGIQSGGGKYIRRIEGDYTNVVGFPLRRLKNEMEDLLHPQADPVKRHLERLCLTQQAHVPAAPVPKKENAVLLPLIETEEGYDILFEKRALDLKHQPGDICLPGGRIEDGEKPIDAAIREATEELLIKREQIAVLFPMDGLIGPRDRTVWPTAALLKDYEGTFAPQEVDHTFRVPLQWFLEQEPRVYKGRRTTIPEPDFPYDLISGGRNYWNNGYEYDILFYQYDGIAIWGVTARIVNAFVGLYRNV